MRDSSWNKEQRTIIRSRVKSSNGWSKDELLPRGWKGRIGTSCLGGQKTRLKVVKKCEG